MALIRGANAAEQARSAVTLHLGDLAREGAQIQTDAAQRAQAFVREARAERERILAGAREQGHAEGFAQGLAAGKVAGAAEGSAAAIVQTRAALDSLGAGWMKALAQFEAGRDHLYQSARADVVRLAFALAERIVKRAIDAHPETVVAQMQAALDLLARPTRLTVAVHPEDDALARRALPALGAALDSGHHVQLVHDARLARGSCVLRSTEGGVIDASIQAQLDRAAELLVPASTAAGAEPPDAASEPPAPTEPGP